MSTHDVPEYRVSVKFKDMFPEKYLVIKAKDLGYTDCEKIEGDTSKINVYCDTMHEGGVIPISINGKTYSSLRMNEDNVVDANDLTSTELSLYYWKPILDDDGKIQLVSYNNDEKYKIVERHGKLQFSRVVDEWTQMSDKTEIKRFTNFVLMLGHEVLDDLKDDANKFETLELKDFLRDKHTASLVNIVIVKTLNNLQKKRSFNSNFFKEVIGKNKS